MIEIVNCEILSETEIVCEIEEQQGILINSGEGTVFVQKSISYGDLLIFTCFFLFFLFYLFKSVFYFIIPKSVKIFTKQDV